MSEMEGRVIPMIFSAILTTCCRFLRSSLGAVSEQGGDTANQEALYSFSVESGENGGWEVGSP